MNKPEFFVTPGYGERQLRLFHYSQAVKIGSRLELSGQGGWNDNWEFPESITDEIAQAFRNVERTLAAAGAGLGACDPCQLLPRRTRWAPGGNQPGHDRAIPPLHANPRPRLDLPGSGGPRRLEDASRGPR